MIDRLKQLQVLTSMTADAELSKLFKLATEDGRLSSELKTVQDARHDTSGSGLQGNDFSPAVVAGILPKWDNWCVQKSVTINNERAELLVELEKQKLVAKRMFGRAEAVKELVKRDMESERMKKNRQM